MLELPRPLRECGLVRRAGFVLVLAAACLCAGAAAAASPPWAGVAFSAFTLDAGNAGCVPWDDPIYGQTRECDPIDVIFPGQSLGTVIARLHRYGWTDAGGTTQWLGVGGTLVPVQWHLGFVDGTDPTQRYHVRLWQVAPGLTVGNVHHEHGTPHQIDMAWDDAEAFLAAGVCGTWCRHVHLAGADAIEGPSGSWRGWPSDGDATVIPLPTPVHSHKRRHRKHTPLLRSP
jgi:hypothetical protein